MKQINRIRFSNIKSSNVRTYGISRELTNRKESCYAENTIVLTDEKPYHDGWYATRKTVDVINRIITLPGVLRLDFSAYEMRVTLASVFDWEDIHLDIITIIKEEYFKGVEQIDIEEAIVTTTDIN